MVDNWFYLEAVHRILCSQNLPLVCIIKPWAIFKELLKNGNWKANCKTEFVSFSHLWVIANHMTSWWLNAVLWRASQCFELLSGLNGFLAEIFDDLMNYVLQLKLIAFETFIFSLKGRYKGVELFSSPIRKCIIAVIITIICSQNDII